MYKLLFSVVIFFITSTLSAQPELCKKDYEKAIDLRNKHNYSAAASAFERAAECPGVTATESAQCKELAKKCRNSANKNTVRKPKTVSGNTPITEPSGTASNKPNENPRVEILFSGYLRATCNGGIRGAEMNVLISAENLKGNNLVVRCFISPKDGSGRVDALSPLSVDYSLENGLSGQEQEVAFVDNGEWVNVNIFVPFSVMDFAGDYSARMMKSDLYVFLKGNKTPLAEHHEVYDALSPHSITLGGRIGDYPLDVDWKGGLLDLHPAVCSGNDVLWQNVPSWVVSDEEGLHVTENDTPTPRTSTLHVTSSGGGNVINVIIRQKGRTEGQGASAKINAVWLEENVVDPRIGIRRFRIHVDCEVSGARGKEIRAYAAFYGPDGTTPIRLSSGNDFKCFTKAIADYTESAFDDIPINVSYSTLSSALNNSGNSAIYYVYISEDKGQSWMAQSGPYTVTW